MKTLRKTAITSLIGIAGSVLSFGNQVLLAARFGASSEMDAYVLGVSGPLCMIGVLAGALGYMLVPELSRRDPAEQKAFAAGLGLTVFGVGAAVALIAIVWLAAAGGPTRTIAALGWLWLPLALVATVYNAACNTKEIFYRPAVLQFAPVAGALGAAWFAGAKSGVVAVVWGQLIGYGVWAWGAARCGGFTRPHRAHWIETWQLLRQIPLSLCGLLIFTVYPVSDAYWGERIGAAAVSHLAYGQRIIVGVTGIFVFGASSVVFARMSRSVRNSEPAAADAETALFVKTITACLIPVALLVGIWSVPLTRELLQRGSFAKEDTAALGALLAPMAAGIIPMAAMTIIFRAYFARHRLKAAALLSFGGTLSYVGISGLLYRPMGSPGIGLAYAAVWWGLLGASAVVLWHRSAFEAGRYFGWAALELAAATLPAAAVAWSLASWVATEGPWVERWVRLGAAGAAVVAVYAVVACGTVPEFRAATGKLRRCLLSA